MKDDQKLLILEISIALLIVSILAVLLPFESFESQRVKRVQLGADEWIILAALVSHSTSSLSSMLAHTEAAQLLTVGVTLDVLLGLTRRPNADANVLNPYAIRFKTGRPWMAHTFHCRRCPCGRWHLWIFWGGTHKD